ncbi:MAG: hypothetical protein JW889_14305 [Verrucomicrobia bacterium]|nr:hypothetical protein [Verrucomicrobiota bacterium]
MYDFEEREALIEATVERLLMSARIDGPPVDPTRIARAARISVLDRELPQRRGQSYLYRGMKFVDLGKTGRTERRNFTLAHEIMELELPIGFHNKQLKHDIAMRGAAALLCPGRFFRACLREDAGARPFDLLRLKAAFSTASHEVVALRSLDFAEATISVFDNGRLVNRQTSHPFGIQPVTPQERDVMRRAMRSGEICEETWDGASAAAYPIFENGFKRVILRTTLDPACL